MSLWIRLLYFIPYIGCQKPYLYCIASVTNTCLTEC